MKDPFRQLEILQQALSSDKSKIAFLLGAGCPVSVQVEDGKPLIPNIEGLMKAICAKLSVSKDSHLRKVISRIQPKPDKLITVEDILTHIRLLIEVVGLGNIDKLTKTNLEGLESEICSEISDVVNKKLPHSQTPYHKLATWISGIQRNNSVEIFTPNYDLLIEAALESQRIPYFDGFIGSHKAFFDLHAIEHETLPSRWAKLWKLHGSVNWWNDLNSNVFRGNSPPEKGKQMIYPSHLKYDQSRRMPFLAMQDRLASFLASGQAIMVICGYSFVDQHLNSIIMQRLSTNPRAICFGLLFDDLEKYPDAINCAQKTSNLTLLARNGTYVGSQKKSWDAKEPNSLHGLEFCVKRTKCQNTGNEKAECSIGDFDVFGHFLLTQIGLSPEVKNAE